MGEEFESMLALGFRILTEGPQQVLVVRTREGELLYASLLHIRENDHREEEALLSTLPGKEVTHMLSLWDNTSLDLPSPFFRQQLLKTCPGSQNALVLLQTGSGQMALPLSMF